MRKKMTTFDNIELILNFTMKLNHFFINSNSFATEKYSKEYKFWKNKNQRSLEAEEDKIVALFYHKKSERLTLFKAK